MEEKNIEQAEFEKLIAERDYYRAQTKATLKPVYKKPSFLIPILLTTVTSIFGNIKYFISEEEKKLTQANLIEKTSYANTISDLFIKNSNIELPIQISIKFKGDIKREIITNLQKLFNRSGFLAGKKIAVKSKSIASSMASYNPSDELTAKQVVKTANAYLEKNGCNSIVELEPDSTIKKGTLNLSILGSCK